MNARQLFNGKLQDFVSDLTEIHPLPDLKVFKGMLELAIKMDATVPSAMFHKCVAVPYGAFIKNKDEAFLTGHTFDEVGQFTDLNIVNRLKTLWVDLSHDNKDAVWKHLQVLLVLSQRCV